MKLAYWEARKTATILRREADRYERELGTTFTAETLRKVADALTEERLIEVEESKRSVEAGQG